MNIGIFCSANDNIDRNYFEMTAELGRWCARNGHSIVFGGCNMGLMGCIAEAFKSASRAEKDKVEGERMEGDKVEGERVEDERVKGGQVIGIVPRIIECGGRTSEHLTVHIPCDNLSDRKDLLLAHSDIVVALPGGIGTLDELFTVAAAHTIGYHHKPVVLYNMCGFWDSLIALLDDLQQRCMIRGHWTDYFLVANTLEELAAIVERGNDCSISAL